MGKNHSTNRERSHTARKKHVKGQHKMSVNNKIIKRRRDFWYEFWNLDLGIYLEKHCKGPRLR